MLSPSRQELSKKKMERRAGACEPCRKQKIKCSGGNVCQQCLKKEGRQDLKKVAKKDSRRDGRKGGKTETIEQCWYDPVHLASTKRKSLGKRKIANQNRSDRDATEELDEHTLSLTRFSHRGPPVIRPGDEHLGPYGMYRCISQFKHIIGSSDIIDGAEAFDLISRDGMVEPSELTNQRPSHSLSYFVTDHELAKAPANIQQMAWRAINMKERQLDKGRIYEATFSQPYLARSFPAVVKARRSQRTSRREDIQLVVEQKTYKLIIDLEIRIKMHLGLPLEEQIKPQEYTLPDLTFDNDTSEPLQNLEVSRTQYRQSALQVLALLPAYKASMASKEAYNDLAALHRQLQAQQAAFVDVASLTHDTQVLLAVSDYQIEHISFSLMLACRLASADNMDTNTEDLKLDMDNDVDTGDQQQDEDDIIFDSDVIIGLCRRLLQVFKSISSNSTAIESASWTRAFATFTAASILCMSLLQSSQRLDSDCKLVDSVLDYFRAAADQQTTGFADLAYARLGDLHSQLSNIKGNSTATRKPKLDAGFAHTGKTTSRATSPHGQKRKRVAQADSAPSSAKRVKAEGVVTPRRDLPAKVLGYGQHVIDTRLPPSSSDVHDYACLSTTPIYEMPFESSMPPSAATSFSSSMVADPLSEAPDYTLMTYPQDWHPPNRLTYPPQEYQFDPQARASRYNQHLPNHMSPPLPHDLTFANPYTTQYGTSPVVAQMRAHGAASPAAVLQQAGWHSGNTTPWSSHAHDSSRRRSEGFILDHASGYTPRLAAIPSYLTSDTATSITMAPYETTPRIHHDITEDDAAAWTVPEHYIYDHDTTEHWTAPEQHQGYHHPGLRWTTPVS